jgi:hypothetical protein
MPTFVVTAPDGKEYDVEAPRGATQEQALAYFQQNWKPQQAAPQEMGWGEVGKQALMNLPESGANIVKGIYGAVTSPVETVSNVAKLAKGGIQNVLPESVVGADPEAQAMASQLGQFYKDRYGSMEGFKKAIATDPAGVLADASTVLTGGGAAVAKVPMLAKAGQVASKVGSAVDPLAMAVRGGAKAVELGGRGAGKVAAMASGVGSEPIEQAYKAGREGGARQTSFVENMRGQVPIQDVLDTAKTDLQAMRQQQQAAYRKDMNAVRQDKSVLDFTDIDAALGSAAGRTQFKGQVVSKGAAEKVQAAQEAVDSWKNLDPAQYHTPEGLDALKQQIGDILESIPFEQRNARAAVGDVYNSIKSTINSQAPSYAKVMRNYSDAAETMREIERSLSLGKQASADTAIRKLQSLMRNNANTNYGQRLSLAKELEKAGGQPLLPALAGQALNEWTPRGIQRGTALGTAGVSYLAGGLPVAIGSAAASSPRLVGETALKAGQLARGLRGAQTKLEPITSRVNPRILANILYQMGINTEGYNQ